MDTFKIWILISLMHSGSAKIYFKDNQPGVPRIDHPGLDDSQNNVFKVGDLTHGETIGMILVFTLAGIGIFLLLCCGCQGTLMIFCCPCVWIANHSCWSRWETESEDDEDDTTPLVRQPIQP